MYITHGTSPEMDITCNIWDSTKGLWILHMGHHLERSHRYYLWFPAGPPPLPPARLGSPWCGSSRNLSWWGYHMAGSGCNRRASAVTTLLEVGITLASDTTVLLMDYTSPAAVAAPCSKIWKSCTVRGHLLKVNQCMIPWSHNFFKRTSH